MFITGDDETLLAQVRRMFAAFSSRKESCVRQSPDLLISLYELLGSPHASLDSLRPNELLVASGSSWLSRGGILLDCLVVPYRNYLYDRGSVLVYVERNHDVATLSSRAI
jgi:hypothetical protein